jgi:hypothetical protein
MIKSKTDYRIAVNNLIRNLLEISILESTPMHAYTPSASAVVLEEMYDILSGNKAPILLESLEPRAKNKAMKEIKRLKKLRDSLLSQPTKRNAQLVEQSLLRTMLVLSEVDEIASDEDTQANNKSTDEVTGNDNSVLGVAASFGAILTELKVKIGQCNDNYDDVIEIAGCQFTAFEDALSQLRALLNSCGDNEECRSKITKAIGRLELLKDQVESIANEEAKNLEVSDLKDKDLTDIPTDYDLY